MITSDYDPQVASRIKARRVEIGLSLPEIAKLSGLTISEYADLENFNEDVFMAISLRDLMNVCEVLRTDLHTIFSWSGKKCELSELIEKIVEKTAGNDAELLELEQESGYKIRDVLQSPLLALNWNLDCLIAICNKTGLPWKAFLPHFTHVVPPSIKH